MVRIRDVLKDEIVRKDYIDTTVSEREAQGRCLKDFYDLFSFKFVEEKDINSLESLDIINKMYETLNYFSLMDSYIGPAGYLLKLKCQIVK